MLIRNAKEKDFMSCVLIAQRAWPQFKERESIYHLFCKFFNDTCFVCEREGEIRAFVFGFISQVNSRQAYIHLVAVDPSAQRHGLAQQLYKKFFEAVDALGAREIRLIVNPDNGTSLAFHKKLGFQVDLTGEIVEVDGVLAAKDYNGPGLHMVPFCRTLP